MLSQPGSSAVEVNIPTNRANGLLYLQDGLKAFKKKGVRLELVNVYIREHGAHMSTESYRWVSPSSYIGIPIHAAAGT